MCLQDQRIAAGGTFDATAVTPGLGNQSLPDMSNMLWFSVSDTTGGAVVVFYKTTVGATNFLPRHSEYIGPLGAPIYYLREQCGSLFLGPLLFAADGIKTYIIQTMRMDSETVNAIQPKQFPG